MRFNATSNGVVNRLSLHVPRLGGHPANRRIVNLTHVPLICSDSQHFMCQHGVQGLDGWIVVIYAASLSVHLDQSLLSHDCCERISLFF